MCSGGFICQHLCQTSNNPVGALRPACAHRPAATMTRTHRESAAAASNAEAAIQTADPHTAFTLPPSLPPSPGCGRLQRSVSDDPQNPDIKTKTNERTTQRVRCGSALQICTWPSEKTPTSHTHCTMVSAGRTTGWQKRASKERKERRAPTHRLLRLWLLLVPARRQ